MHIMYMGEQYKILRKATEDIFAMECQKKGLNLDQLENLPGNTLLDDESESIWLEACVKADKIGRAATTSP
ncbi:MAG: hypothetical protein WAZ50_02920 [Minisyncoccia bacterium]